VTGSDASLAVRCRGKYTVDPVADLQQISFSWSDDVVWVPISVSQPVRLELIARLLLRYVAAMVTV
jgi:hypothetical protein